VEAQGPRPIPQAVTKDVIPEALERNPPAIFRASIPPLDPVLRAHVGDGGRWKGIEAMVRLSEGPACGGTRVACEAWQIDMFQSTIVT